MNQLQFLTAMLESEQRFRKIVESLQEVTHVNQTPLPNGNAERQLVDSTQPTDVPNGVIRPE